MERAVGATRSRRASCLFYKAKDLLPSEEKQDDPPNQTWTAVQSKKEKRSKNKKKKRVKIKGRWVGGGHKQKKHEALRDRVAPTARSTTHAIVMAIAAKEKRQIRVGDIPSAYLQAEHVAADGKPTFIRADKETTRIIIKVYPDLANYVMPNGTMILEVARALYGLVESAWLWYQELSKTLTELGYTVTEADRGLFVKKAFRGDRATPSSLRISSRYTSMISSQLHRQTQRDLPCQRSSGTTSNPSGQGSNYKRDPGSNTSRGTLCKTQRPE